LARLRAKRANTDSEPKEQSDYWRANAAPKELFYPIGENKMKNQKGPLDTESEITWCPGCPDHKILDATKIAITNLIKQGYKQENFAMVAGIGCHGKIFDYLNISGFNGLHGRALPTALGIKFGNPNLKVLVFCGDGDCYSEGMSHFIHTCKNNPDLTLLVHDNQSFSLTTGQITPTSEVGFKSKTEPLGKSQPPLNPIKLALAAGATFIARANARDAEHTAMLIEAAAKHKGFSYIEVMQDCLVFNVPMLNRDSQMYKLAAPCQTKDAAFKLADEYDYNQGKGKIALGVIWQDTSRKSLEETWPQLQTLVQQKVGWKNFKK
jgi:2-oxoglutarate/2-oxoacid ferredoxin oxidoreductase subunit beta